MGIHSFYACTGVLFSKHSHSENIYNKIKCSYDYHLFQSNNRSSYVKEDSRCFVIGQSEIGKTVSLNVYIRMAVVDRLDVIVETRSNRYFISKDDILLEPLGGLELLAHCDKPDVLIFHDPQANTEPPLRYCYSIPRC